ncbi:MAG: cyclic nucleotide-binding domain-containing protein [Anaerolineaceae bacterium]|nr:cyclic nucleotide-binding domain-containing protein [Anaerolineaceae bacterium]
MDKPASSAAQLIQGIFPFSDLDPRTQASLAPLVERESFAAGTTIYAQDGPAKAVYFILSGHVEITRQGKKETKSLSQLEAGDHFGEDAIAGSGFARSTAVALSRVMVLKINRAQLAKVYERAPILRRLFKVFYKTYSLLTKIDLPWRQAHETVYILTRRTRYLLWLRVVPLAVLALAGFTALLYFSFVAKFGNILWLVLAFLALGFGLFVTAWSALEWSNDYFILTKDRVLMQRMLIGMFDSRQETPMTAVLSTGLERSFLGRLIGFGTVTARAYTGDLALPNLPDPDLVFAILEYRRKTMSKEMRRAEQEGMESMLQNRLRSSDQRVTQPLPTHRTAEVTVNYYSGDFFDLLAKFFNLRIEKDGSVIYRTHWWMLMKKTFLPTLFLIGIIVLVVLRLLDVFTFYAAGVYLLAIAGAVVGWGWWFYRYLDWFNDVYIISPDQLMDVNRKPLGHEEKRSAPVKNIQTVEYERKGLIALLLNYGTVGIKIGNELFTFDNVYNPSAVQIEIFNRFRESADHSRQMEQGRIADYISIYDKMKKQNTFEENDNNQTKNG